MPRDEYYLSDCDTGLQVPLPASGVIKSSGDYTGDAENEDCHLLVVHGDTVYEAWLSDIDSQGIHSQYMVT